MSERDIVERLREHYPERFKDEQPGQVIFEYEWERSEAADEIERLQSYAEANMEAEEIIIELKQEIERLDRAYLSQREEIERLREALKGIARQKKMVEIEADPDIELDGCDFDFAYDAIIEDARAALKAPTP